jgi:hypothetical protein
MTPNMGLSYAYGMAVTEEENACLQIGHTKFSVVFWVQQAVVRN